jgi:hypothetical protein
MLTCPSGNVFMGSIDSIGEWKDAHYICNALVGYIGTIGVYNIVQICTKNVSNMKSATNLLIHHFQTFIFKVVLFIVWIYYWKLGKNNMGETNCEKGGSYCFFPLTTPCAINNLSLLRKQPNVVELN